MYFRTFYFILFIATSLLFFLSSYTPNFTLRLCDSICKESLSLEYIQLTSMIASSISLILLVFSNYYTQKRTLMEKERIATERLNIEKIHAELEALKN